MHTLQAIYLGLLHKPLFICLLLMLILAVITDLKDRKIPNKLVLIGLIASLVLQSHTLQVAGSLNWLAGVVVAFACFIPLYLLRAMAAGDVKLMMAVGGFLGYPLILSAVTYSYLAGGAIAICYVLMMGRFRQLIQNLYALFIDKLIKTTSGVNVYDEQEVKPSVGRMPFALAIALGTFITILQSLGNTI